MRALRLSAVILGLLSSTLLLAAPATRPAGLQGAPSKIVAVTVYETSALVTREVTTPEGAGTFELVVSPLPTSTVQSSLYSEGNDGIRILTTRYRTWTMQENLEEEMRKVDAQIKDIQHKNEALQAQIKTNDLNLQLMSKMEEFTAGSLKQMTEKGMLNAESVTKIADFVMTTRQAKAAENVTLQQQIQSSQERANYLSQERAKMSAGSDRTIREAVIVVDKPNAGVAKVRLNYLVSAASWRPQYKLRAAAPAAAAAALAPFAPPIAPDEARAAAPAAPAAAAKPEIQLEYLAAIFQQSGEDWSDVELTLSTAQPLLNAAPPELAMLDVTVARGGPGTVTINGGIMLNTDNNYNRQQAQQFRGEGQSFANARNKEDASKRFNDAAALDQSDEIVNPIAAGQFKTGGGSQFREGQSVTFNLKRRFTVPWRDDEQIVEVTRLALKPDYFYKAVPVLTTHVYRLANLINTSEFVILPGEATMYLGKDFVGRATLPLVAIGEQFTAGFGVDPQLQVARTLVDKSKTVQGGNQVLKFDYRLSVSSYKNEAVKLQVWDRLPHSETEAVNITLIESKTELSKDPTYLRDERTKNLLRWDLTVEPGTSGEKATNINYQFKLEFAKEAAIGGFLSR